MFKLVVVSDFLPVTQHVWLIVSMVLVVLVFGFLENIFPFPMGGGAGTCHTKREIQSPRSLLKGAGHCLNIEKCYAI